VIPTWLSREAWNEWCSFRKAGRAPWTPRARSLSIAALEKLRAEGHDPRAVIDQSILNGWRGLFPVRGGEQRKNGDLPHDDGLGRARKLLAEREARDVQHPA
jgi:hypothetical protein